MSSPDRLGNAVDDRILQSTFNVVQICGFDRHDIPGARIAFPFEPACFKRLRR